MPKSRPMNLGWCDVCLRVGSVETTSAFYQGLGFRVVEGNLEEGWAVVTNDEIRLGLFEQQFMDDDSMSLNFRGGDIPKIAKQLISTGITFEKEPTQGQSGGWSAKFRDPDGRLIFLDSEPGETKKT